MSQTALPQQTAHSRKHTTFEVTPDHSKLDPCAQADDSSKRCKQRNNCCLTWNPFGERVRAFKFGHQEYIILIQQSVNLSCTRLQNALRPTNTPTPCQRAFFRNRSASRLDPHESNTLNTDTPHTQSKIHIRRRIQSYITSIQLPCPNPLTIPPARPRDEHIMHPATQSPAPAIRPRRPIRTAPSHLTALIPSLLPQPPQRADALLSRRVRMRAEEQNIPQPRAAVIRALGLASSLGVERRRESVGLGGG